MSLAATTLVIGRKIGAFLEIAVMHRRRKELKNMLKLLIKERNSARLKAWLVDTAHDQTQRSLWVQKISSTDRDQAYSADENRSIQIGLAMFAVFEQAGGKTKTLKHNATVDKSETKYDDEHDRLIGRSEALIRGVEPAAIVAYLMDFNGRYAQSRRDPRLDVRCDVLEEVNDHHSVIYNSFRMIPGFSNRAVLMSMVYKRVGDADDFVWVAVPRLFHRSITEKDEQGVVRAEVVRACRFTRIAEGTKLEYVCSLDLKGRVPKWAMRNIALPAQMHLPYTIQACLRPLARSRLRSTGLLQTEQIAALACVASCAHELSGSTDLCHTLQVYFQQLRDACDCTAKDGRLVGSMIMDSIRDIPNAEVGSAIQNFMDRTAMLRALEFPHFNMLLAAAVSAGLSKTESPAAVLAADAASISEADAQRLGLSLSATLLNSVSAAAAVDAFIQKHPVLRTICNTYAWLKPLFQVVAERIIASPEAKLRRMTRSSSAFRDPNVPVIASLRRGFAQVVPETVPGEPGDPGDCDADSLGVILTVCHISRRSGRVNAPRVLMLAYLLCFLVLFLRSMSRARRCAGIT